MHCMHSHAGAWERETVSVCMHSHAGAWERENGQRMYALYAFPRRSVGTRKRSAYVCIVCIPTQERGNEKTVSVCMHCMHSHAGAWERENGQRNVCACMHSHAEAWERETVSVMYALYAFPRRSVGTRNGQRMYALYAFPRRSVGTRNGQRNVCIPTQERGNEKTVSVCMHCMHSHAEAWERENGQRMYAFPRRSVGTRKRSA